MSLFSKLFKKKKQSGEKKKIESHDPSLDTKGYKETMKAYCQLIPLYLIFRSVSEDIKAYERETPLFIAVTPAEAINACHHMAYIKNFNHYVLWCKLRSYKIGYSEPSWAEYMSACLGGLSYLDETFKIIRSPQPLQLLVSAYRSVKGCVCGFKLVGETPSEAESFLSNNIAIGEDDPNRLLTFDELESNFPAEFFGVKDIAELVAKAYMFSEESAIAAIKEQRAFFAKNVDDIQQTIDDEIASGEEGDSTARNTVLLYSSIEDYVKQTIDISSVTESPMPTFRLTKKASRKRKKGDADATAPQQQ